MIKTAKAGFAVAVEAGSFYDPVELPGLARGPVSGEEGGDGGRG